MTTKPISGSCLCGQITYEYTGIPGPSSYCHCSDCRKITGTAFMVSVRCEERYFTITSGNKTKSFTKTADSGNPIIRDFCPDCGSPIFTKSPNYPEYIWVRAGTLDDPSFITPAHQSWTDSKVAWADIPRDIKSFRKGSG